MQKVVDQEIDIETKEKYNEECADLRENPEIWTVRLLMLFRTDLIKNY